MSGKKKVLMVLVILLLLGSVAAGLVWNLTHYVAVDFRFYPRDAKILDLRGETISVSHYEKLCRRMPECLILWDVPFQGGAYAEDTREVTVTALSDSDLGVLDYLTELETVHGGDCTDYAQLFALRERRPEVDVRYNVALGGRAYSRDVTRVDLEDIAPEEISLLGYLPKLKTVVCGGGDTEAAAQLQEYCHGSGLEFCIGVGGESIADSAQKVTVRAITDEELDLLRLLTEMKQLHIVEPEASAENLIRLRDEYPDGAVTWEREICGVLCTSEDEEIDLSGGKIGSLDQVDAGMAYFPDAERVFLGECGLDNDELAGYREQVREKYKLVWTVSCGNKLKARTDDTTFMPVRERVYYFNDEEAYNLRYCEDMVCIDIGHMSIHQIDFVEYMPNLEYLILAHTQVQYIEPIRSCKKLKFLELDWGPIKDLSPLVDCTALEDLNLGNTYADFDPIGRMTWLKNLWMIGCSRGSAYQMTQALTDTKVMVSGSATVANGWRNLQNYYDMRDLLGMEYMSW